VSGVDRLAGIRAELRTRLDEIADGPDAHSAAGERLLLAVEELTSNALRHGEAPVRTDVTATDNGWLLAVTDQAGDRPPVQAVDRDPALGGLGLQLTAMLSSAHGWVTEDTCKHVWAFLPHQPGDQLP
jgi:anti-sigma regulatory factor (Ser/Thr protein kinase)